MKRIILWLVVLGGLLGCQKVMAAEKGGLFLSPPSVDVTVGQTQPENSFDLEVGNNGLAEETLDLSVVDFGSLDETGGIAFLTVNSDKSERKYALASWVSLEKSEVTVASGKTEKVKVTVLNKDSLAPGGHYGAVLATVRSETGGNQPEVGVNQSLATLIYALKSGGEIPDLEFNSLEFNKNFFYFPKTVKLRFENNGNVHVVPRGTVNITDSSGKVVAQGIINAGSGKVLPETFRTLEVPINKIIIWNRPGIYTLAVNYRYDGRDRFSTVKTTVVYFGYEGVVILLVVAGGAALATYLILRKKRR